MQVKKKKKKTLLQTGPHDTETTSILFFPVLLLVADKNIYSNVTF